MAGSAVDSGYKMLLVGGTSGFTGELVSISISGMSREAIDVTHMSSAQPTTVDIGGKEYIPSALVDPGTITATVHANTGAGAQTAIPPLNQAAETWTVTLPQTGAETAATFAGTGFMTEATLTGEIEAAVTYDVTIKMTGTWDITAAA